MEKFDFSEAFSHWHKAEGAASFMWKFALGFVLAVSVIYGAMFLLFGSSIMSFYGGLLGSPETVPSDREAFQFMGAFFGAFFLGGIAYMLLMSAFESAALRHYIRKQPFRLKYGKDEFRILAVYLAWFGLFIASYVVFFIVIMVITIPFAVAGVNEGPAVGIIGLLVFVGFFALMIFGLYWMIRLSPASAVTIRDEKIAVFSATKTSKNRFWPMFGAMLVIYIIVGIAQFVLQTIWSGFVLIPMFANPEALNSENPSDVFAGIFTPTTIIVSIMLGLLMMALSALTHYAFLGVTSKAAITDPSWSDVKTVADEF